MARGLLLTAYMSDDAVRELKALERRFPAEFSRALSGYDFGNRDTVVVVGFIGKQDAHR